MKHTPAASKSSPNGRGRGGMPALWLAPILVLASCAVDPGPRRPAYPLLDPRGAFPELTNGTGPSAADAGLPWLETACGGDRAGERQWLVGGSLAVNLPSGAWRARVDSRGERRLLRVEDQGQVVAWAYFEEMDLGDGPAQFGRFLHRVDPGLVANPPIGLPAPAAVPTVEPKAPESATDSSQPTGAGEGEVPGERGSSAGEPTPAPPSADAAATLARALEPLADSVAAAVEPPQAPATQDGYTSLPGTFTGWRWIGRCRNDPTLPTLRLARTLGTWRHGDSVDAAYMVVGSASLPRGVGVYLAIVATYPPANPQALDLARLLASFHAGHGRGGMEPGVDPVAFAEWARAFGVAGASDRPGAVPVK